MTMLALCSAAIWIYLLGFRGGFWRVAEPAPVTAPAAARRVTVIIPARDEAAGIARTVSALLHQDYPGALDLIVVDDGSSDGTAGLARDAAAGLGQAARLRVISGTARPPGWTGKLWAVAQGLAAAQACHTPDYFLLTDGDIEHAPQNLGRLVARAEAENLDLTSQMVRLHCATPPERAFIPAFVFFFFMLYPPRWVADPARGTAAAAGGSMLIRPAALDRIGGIAAIRGALIDDCALAAAVKSTGGRVRLDVAAETASSRVYAGWQEIWSMIARTAFTQLRHSPLLLAGTLGGLALTYWVPPVAALFGQGWTRGLGLATWIAMAAAMAPTLRLYRQSLAWGLALPAIAAFYAGATLGSACRYWSGRGGQWKGRYQAANGVGRE